MDETFLKGEVESDEAYITAGCKGNNNTRPKDREPRCRGLKRRGRGTYESDKVPILGLVEREGDIHFSVVKNVQTATVKPIMEQVIVPDTTIYTDDYSIYNFLDDSDEYTRKVVCHSKGEYALDLNGDGKNECHVNTQEGIWSILRPWIRPHRGINKRYLAFYVCLCEFVYRNSQLTPTQQIRKIIRSAVSFSGYNIKEAFKHRMLMPLCATF